MTTKAGRPRVPESEQRKLGKRYISPPPTILDAMKRAAVPGERFTDQVNRILWDWLVAHGYAENGRGGART